jgi:hypothetical protein
MESSSIEVEHVYKAILEYASKLPADMSITPGPDVNALNGFSYALGELLGKYSLYDSIYLKKLEENNYLQGEFYDKILLCPYCLAYNLSFRDVCPECSSANLVAVTMFHHFRCGYMGYESEFFKDNKLICPKCAMELKYIGKDYECPTEIYECLACNWKGTNILTSGHCIACDKEVLPENCIILDIKSYKITLHGKLALETDNIQITEKIEAVNLPTREEVNLHFSKIIPLLSLANAIGVIHERYERPMIGMSIFPDVFFKVQNLDFKQSLTYDDKLKLKMYLSDRVSTGTTMSSNFSKMLLKEIKKMVRNVDFIAPLSNNGYFGILPETSVKNGILFTERLCEKVRNLKFGGTFTQTTLSIGIAKWTKSEDAIDLIIKTNKAMLKAIDSGGNKVIVLEE